MAPDLQDFDVTEQPVKRIIRARAAVACAVLLLLTACHRDPQRYSTDETVPPPSPERYTVAGSIAGLSGTGLALRINDGETLAILGNGPFAFPTAIAAGTAFNVVVAHQPENPAQVCTVSGGSGTLSANVTNVSIICATQSHTLGGTVTGLVGTGLSLASGTGEQLSITENGTFVFPTAIADGAAYDVTITSQPAMPAQVCTLGNGSGTMSANVTNVSIACTTNTYSVGATISGLSGTGLVLQLNGSNDMPIAGNGAFTFSPSLIDGAAYSVTVLAQPTAPLQTCVVTSGAGSIPADNVSVSVVCTVNRYTVGGTVAGLVGRHMVLNNGIEQLTVDANGSFTFPTPLDPGSSYDVVIDHPPGAPAQQCLLTQGSGTVGAANVTNVSVTCDVPTYPTFMLSANAADDTLSVLAMDEGRLRSREPVPTGSLPIHVAIYEAAGTTRFAYVANRNSDDVSAFAFDAREGKLEQIAGSPFNSGDDPVHLTLHPTKPFLYAFNNASRTLQAFTIDEASGALTARNAVNVQSPTVQVLIEPTGHFAYVLAFSGIQALQTYAIDQVTGALTAAATVNIPTRTGGMTFDGEGRHLYVFNPGSDLVYSYALDALTGEPVAMAGSPVATGGEDLEVLATHPNGRLIYAAAPQGFNGQNGVTVFAISPTGTLSVVPGSPFGTGINPLRAQLDPTGRHLYLMEFAGGWLMHKFTVDTATGTLSAPVSTPVSSGSLVQAPLIDSRGEHLYQPGSASILAYGLDADTGALVPSNWSVVPMSDSSSQVIAEDSAPLEFVSDAVVSTSEADSRIYSFRLSSAGVLTGRSTIPVSFPASLTIGPSGGFAYVPRSGNTVATFAIEPTNSTLSLFDEWMLAGSPAPIAMSATGRYSYVATGDALRTFVTDPETGYWNSSLPTVTLSTEVAEALVHPGGSFLYTRAVVDGTPNESRLFRYIVDPVTGVVDPVGNYAEINGPVGAMAIHPSGGLLYVVNTEDELIQGYSIVSNGILLSLNADMPFVANGETGLAIDARGRFLFAITATGDVQTFAIGTQGQLTDLGASVPLLNTATAIAADYSGNYLIVTDGGVDAVKTYRIADDGSLIYVSSVLRSLSPGVHSVKTSGRLQ